MTLTGNAPVQAREKLWRDVLNVLPIGVALIDRDGNFEHINEEGRRIYGGLVGSAVSEARAVAIQRALHGEAIYDREFIQETASGEQRVLLGSLIPLRDDTGAVQCLVGLSTDITARKHAEGKLHESQMRLQRIFDSEPECVKVLSRDARLLEMNPAGLAMLAVDSIDGLLGQSILALVHPADRRAYAASHRAIIQGQHTTLEFRMVDVRGRVHWMEQYGVPLPSREGPASVLTVTREISGRKELEAQLHQAQRLESVGRLAGGIAHDFNNLLTVIIGCAELVLGVNKGGAATEEWQEALAAARRAAELTSQLLAFARQQPILPRVVDLNSVVRGVDTLLRRVIGEQVRLIVETDTDPLPVNIDPGQFEQILVNLAVNARDAMPHGGTVRVVTSQRTLSEGDARTRVGLPAGPIVELSVSDTGVGIPADIRQHIFEPFFTTKGPGRGTGLGLSMCYGIVRQAGGTIEVESTVGIGSRFTVSLPRAAGEIRAAAPIAAPVDAVVYAAHILVVEDEAGVAELTRRALEFGGYRVTVARNAADALRVIATERDNLSLVLTDVVMPDMRGTELARIVLAQDPLTKVMFMSGYPGSLEKEFPGARLLHKPFTPTDLLRSVAEALRK
jgi:two-component system, cell cycle sensor histidine kinase and response regulator CckA